MQSVYKNIEKCNPQRERKVVIAFNDMIANLIVTNFSYDSNQIITELFISGRKLNISAVFIPKSY